MRTMRYGVALAALLGLVGTTQVMAQNPCSASGAAPQSCSVNDAVSATVNAVVKLTLASTATDLGSPAAADYDAGFKEASGQTATIKANKAWNLKISAGAGTFGGGSGSKASSDLHYYTGACSGAAGTALSTTAATLTSGATGSDGSVPVAVCYHTLWNWTSDTPGTYTLTVTYTLTAP